MNLAFAFVLFLSGVSHAGTVRCADDLAPNVRTEFATLSRDPLFGYDLWSSLENVQNSSGSVSQRLKELELWIAGLLRPLNRENRRAPRAVAHYLGLIMLEEIVGHFLLEDVQFTLLENALTECPYIGVDPAGRGPQNTVARSLHARQGELRLVLDPCFRYQVGAAGLYSEEVHTLVVGDGFATRPSVREDVMLHELRHARTRLDSVEGRASPYGGHVRAEGGKLPGPADHEAYSEDIGLDETRAGLASIRHLILALKRAVRTGDAEEIASILRRLKFGASITRVLSLRVLASVSLLERDLVSARFDTWEKSRRARLDVSNPAGGRLHAELFFPDQGDDLRALARQLDWIKRSTREYVSRFDDLARIMAQSPDPEWLVENLMWRMRPVRVPR